MSRLTGIAWCLVDFVIQVGLTVRGWFVSEEKEEEMDDSERFYHE